METREAIRGRSILTGGWYRPRTGSRWAPALENAATPIALMDAEGRILSANKALCELLGLPLQAVLAGSLEQLLQLREGSLADCRRELAKACVQPVQFEAHLTTEVDDDGADRADVWVEVDARPLRLPGERVSSVVVTLRDITERKRAEKTIEAVTAQLSQARNDERRRIAGELHSVTAQDLSLLIMDLSRLRDLIGEHENAAQRIIKECLSLSTGALDGIRTLSYTLYPPLLDELGLIPGLRRYARGFSARSGIAVRFVGSARMERLPRDVEAALFLVTQECLLNIQRHSGSTHARISLTMTENHVILRVSDHGHGIVREESFVGTDDIAAPGVGIASMRERLRQLGGRLEIRSTERGTRVVAMVPIIKEANNG